ncbi:MAG: GNAT family N-acetyltransferase [bacterium]|nr:GNAT family N-acetyltransferase [bacterium]
MRRAAVPPRTALAVGERVFLRHPMAGDRSEFTAAVCRSRKQHRPFVYAPSTRSAFDAYLQRLRRSSHEGYLVCSLETRAIVGIININEIVRGGLQSGFLGYYALAPFEGKGLMAEGLELVIERAFEKLKLHRLEANIQPVNKRSIALVERSGFQREGFSYRYLKVGGRWRDHERWAILAEGRRHSRAR